MSFTLTRETCIQIRLRTSEPSAVVLELTAEANDVRMNIAFAALTGRI